MMQDRIAIFFHSLVIGGAERVMLQLAEGFLEVGHPVDLVLARAQGPLKAELPPNARVIDFDTSSPLTMFFKLIRYLRIEKPKALLSPFEVTSVIAIVAKKITGVTTRIVVRVSVNLSRNKRTRWKKIFERWVISVLYPLADGLVAVSQGVANDLADYARIPLKNIKVVYNPTISNKIVVQMKQPVDHSFFSNNALPVILGVGRLEEQKDFHSLIKAFGVVRKKIPARLVILGEGQDRHDLKSLVDSLGLTDWVDIPGIEPNPFAFMKRSSVFVLSSKWEGLPNTLIQALACECPVVSTDCLSGPTEILNGGEYGYLVPVGDVKALADAIESVLVGNIRKPPKEWLDQFTLKAIIPQYESVLGV